MYKNIIHNKDGISIIGSKGDTFFYKINSTGTLERLWGKD